MTTKTMMAALMLCLGLSAPALAVDEHHPEKAKEAQAAAKPTSATAAADIKAMQGNVATMQGQLNRIAKAKTDEEREKLLAEHVRTLHDSMRMARGMAKGTTAGMDMAGCPMMEGMMAGKGGMSGMGMQGPGGPAPDSSERMDRMEKRMEMMEQMLKGGMVRP